MEEKTNFHITRILHQDVNKLSMLRLEIEDFCLDLNIKIKNVIIFFLYLMIFI